MKTEKTLSLAAAKAGMDEKTARRYRRSGKWPSEMSTPHTWRTRPDPFAAVWDEVREQLEANPGLEAKTLFEDLQRRYPGRFSDGQLRTLQRRVKVWRAVAGPQKEVMFEQVHEPGALCQSDYTRMGSLGVTIAGLPFDHMVYHFVLTYSNWEAGTVCFSESFESLSEGLQSALFELGGVPRTHQSDRMSAAVSNLSERKDFTERYAALLGHYGMQGRKSQAGKAHEHGDIEQRHHRFKRAVEQGLLLRGSRDFASREAYEAFLRRLFDQLNAGRRQRLAREIEVLRPLPATRYDRPKEVDATVSSGSLIRVQNNVYSVSSRLIGETVRVRFHAETLEVLYGQRCVEVLPRLRGRKNHRVNYRHVIDSLVRKPGAFDNYRYREDLFPTSRFRMAYDALKGTMPARAHKEYLQILRLAARETETGVDDALRILIDAEQPITAKSVAALVKSGQTPPPVTDVRIDAVDLGLYDGLLDDLELEEALT
ncbi:MAG: IS21 family transposase [Planctomycetota bacterium]